MRQDFIVPLEVSRVLSYEQVLVPFETLHQVAGANALTAFIIPDANDGRIEMPTRAAVPARLEGGIKRQAVMGDFDGNDLAHYGSPLSSGHDPASVATLNGIMLISILSRTAARSSCNRSTCRSHAPNGHGRSRTA